MSLNISGASGGSSDFSYGVRMIAVCAAVVCLDLLKRIETVIFHFSGPKIFEVADMALRIYFIGKNRETFAIHKSALEVLKIKILLTQDLEYELNFAKTKKSLHPCLIPLFLENISKRVIADAKAEMMKIGNGSTETAFIPAICIINNKTYAGVFDTNFETGKITPVEIEFPTQNLSENLKTIRSFALQKVDSFKKYLEKEGVRTGIAFRTVAALADYRGCSVEVDGRVLRTNGWSRCSAEDLFKEIKFLKIADRCLRELNLEHFVEIENELIDDDFVSRTEKAFHLLIEGPNFILEKRIDSTEQSTALSIEELFSMLKNFFDSNATGIDLHLNDIRSKRDPAHRGKPRIVKALLR